MNKIDGLNEQQRNEFDNLLKSLLDAQNEFEMGIQNYQSNPEADLTDLRRKRAYAFEQAIEQLDFLVEKEELYLKLAELMLGDDDQTLPIGGIA